MFGRYLWLVSIDLCSIISLLLMALALGTYSCFICKGQTEHLHNPKLTKNFKYGTKDFLVSLPPLLCTLYYSLSLNRDVLPHNHFIITKIRKITSVHDEHVTLNSTKVS